jgi:hypothetical protein
VELSGHANRDRVNFRILYKRPIIGRAPADLKVGRYPFEAGRIDVGNGNNLCG